MAAKKGGLGTGFDVLFFENAIENDSTSQISINDIEPNHDQPRKSFDDEAMAELADSIAVHGILQPLIVRPLTSGNYQIVAGERRWRAARMAGLTEVPVIIRSLTDKEVSELALIENLQREDLNPIEEAMGYQNLINQYGFTQEEISKRVGKSRPAVTNALRLLSLEQEILDFLAAGEFSQGHARSLLAIKDSEKRIEVAKFVIKNDLSVRELEKLVKKINAENEEKQEKTKLKSVFFSEVELALTEHLGRKVKVNGKKEGKGILEIEFYSEDDLAEIAKLLEIK